MRIQTWMPILAVGALALPLSTHAALTITPAAGHILTWDGNEGDYFDDSGVAVVPPNAALGGTAIASNPTSPHFPPHDFANLNDGFYGNSYSHINGGGPDPSWMGIIGLPDSFQINTIAFGRDNGTPGGATPPGGPLDCCGGQLSDRVEGVYTLQYTNDGGGSWISIGTLNYVSDGAFASHLRHQYDVATDAGPILGNGVRILLPNNGVAIDEIEINTVPEPSSVALLGLGLLGFVLRRRR